MKKLAVGLLLVVGIIPSKGWADIAVTQGSGKTVATTTDNSREFQNVVVSTSYINNAAGVPTAIGYATGGSSVPVNVLNTVPASQSGTWTVQPGNTPNTSDWRVTFSSIGVLSDNGVAATTNRVGVLNGISQTSYRNGTAATQGRDSAASYGTDGLLWTANLPALRPASYSASTNTFAVAASATDIATLCGNGSNTVLLYSLRVSCVQTTAGNVPLTIFKRSAVDTGVLWSTMTVVPMDSTMNLFVSTAALFSAAPTVGTAVGQLDNYNLGCMATATATPNDIYISPADWRMKPIVLRNASQCVAVNLNSTTVTGGKFSVTFSWIETATLSP